MTLDIGFYVARFLSRLPLFLFFAVSGTAIGVGLALTLPPVYRAQAVLVVESPQIPGELAASTVQAPALELLQIIEQRILTRANLIEMAREFQVFDDIASMNPDQIVEQMRERIEIRLPGLRDTASFVRVAFPASDPALSARVTNDLVTQIIGESVEIRTATTGQTLDFFEQEVARLGEDLGRAGAKIMDFKLVNKDALPDSLDFRRNRQALQQERLLQIERELASLRDRRARLVDLYERTGQIGAVAEARSPEERELQQLRSELAGALALYSPQNPRIVVLQNRITQLEAQLADLAGAEPGLSPFDIQISDLDAQIEFLEQQIALIEEELEALKISIDATPGNAVELDALQRDYDNIQLQYNAALARQATAATGDRIEALSRGQRVSVIEQAVVPREPDSPNRRMIAVAGAGGGVMLGAGMVFLLEFLNRAIQRPADLTQRLGIAPFATIPYIRTRRDTVRRRAVILGLLLTAVAAIVAGLYSLHVFYLPLDLLIERLLERLGLDGFAASIGLG